MQGILNAIGNTPMVRLDHVLDGAPFSLYAKLEGMNPGGSMKDRVALQIIRRAMEEGAIQSGTVVIESTSGNMGIGLAQVCRYYGLRLICVVDPKSTEQNLRLLRAYGAEVDLVREPDPVTHDFLQARLNRVRGLLQSINNSYWPNQYANLNNPVAHMQTMEEIVTALDGRLDYVFCATSTCGTLRGCSEYVRRRKLSAKVIAVDAVGSVLFSTAGCKRLIPGHGASIHPELYQSGLADDFRCVTANDCVVGCRMLLDREALLVGGSSGGVMAAVAQMREHIEPGANCVGILADRGDRYLETIFCDDWVTQHIGPLRDLKIESADEKKCVMASS
jgi:cysteine synthase A